MPPNSLQESSRKRSKIQDSGEVAIVRNSVNIEWTHGCPASAYMPAFEGTGVSIVGFGGVSAAVDRKRIAMATPAARVQINDLPYVASAPPPERRT